MANKFKILFAIIAVLILGYLAFVFDVPYSGKVVDFASCVAAGNEATESVPRRCTGADGTLYVENVATGDLSTLIRVTVPSLGARVTSPIVFSGSARGTWYFEASFPVIVLDATGKEIGHSIAKAKGDWMTPEFVPFEGTVTLESTPTATGTMVFKKDNPSGDSALDLSYSVPVAFSGAPATGGACVVSGCSSEICSDSDMVSTCQFKVEYACYAKAHCERQASGSCGWTKTPEYKACITTIK